MLRRRQQWLRREQVRRLAGDGTGTLSPALVVFLLLDLYFSEDRQRGQLPRGGATHQSCPLAPALLLLEVAVPPQSARRAEGNGVLFLVLFGREEIVTGKRCHGGAVVVVAVVVVLPGVEAGRGRGRDRSRRVGLLTACSRGGGARVFVERKAC